MSNKIRVLYVHPDEKQRQHNIQLLTRLGHEAIAVANGLECLATFREFKPNVLMLNPSNRWGGAEGILGVLRGEGLLAEVQVLWTHDEVKTHPQLDLNDSLADKTLALSLPERVPQTSAT